MFNFRTKIKTKIIVFLLLIRDFYDCKNFLINIFVINIINFVIQNKLFNSFNF